MPLRTRCGTSRLPCMSLGVRAQGLGPRGGGTALAITICSVLPSVPYDAVGPPNSIFLSRLNTQPTRCPVNASPLPSRTATHDSGPTWFATPWLGGTCTRETYRFVPAHREVKILMRLPNGRNVATRQAVYGSAPCARTEVVLRKKSIQRYAIFLFADHRPTGAGGSWLETNGKQGKPGNSGVHRQNCSAHEIKDLRSA